MLNSKDFTVTKALAIQCFDLKYNGRLIQRFDRKREAEQAKQNLIRKMLNK